MKGIGKTILITSVIMMIGIGTLCVFLYKQGEKSQEIKKEQKLSELDMLYEGYQKATIDKDAAVKLSDRGEHANLKTIEYEKTDNVYSLDRSTQTKKQLERWKKLGDYSLDSPLFVWNLYGTNRLSMYIYFETPDPYSIEYSICVEDPAIPDFTRIGYIKGGRSVTQKHEYQLIGFIPGMTNYIVFRVYDKDHEIIAKRQFSIDVPKLPGNTATRLKAESGSSKENMTNGLFFVMDDSDTPHILMYDNSGIIRGELPLVSGCSADMVFLTHEMYYEYDNGKLAKVDALGQVTNLYSLDEYDVTGSFMYNGYGQIWMTGKKKNSKHSDLLLSLSLSSGKVEILADFKKLLPEVYQNMNHSTDWISLGSLAMTGTSDVLVAAENLSSLIHLKYVTTDKVRIDYILGDSAIWKNTKYKSLLLKPAKGEEEKTAHGKLSFVSYNSFGKFSKNYDIGVFNPKYIDASKYKGLDSTLRSDKKGNESFYYMYGIQPKKNKYILKRSFEINASMDGGGIQSFSDHLIISCNEISQYGEYDKTGRVLYKYKGNKTLQIHRVVKQTMKDFWFQDL